MFLAPGVVPGSSWIEETAAFVARTTDKRPCFRCTDRPDCADGCAACSRRSRATKQGLIIRKAFYAELGGHRADAADPERDLLRRIGRSRLTVLRAPISRSNI